MFRIMVPAPESPAISPVNYLTMGLLLWFPLAPSIHITIPLRGFFRVLPLATHGLLSSRK